MSLDGRADRSGRRAFPPRATRSERRKWRKVMRKLKKAMPSILQEAARAAAEGALQPQTQATDWAARRARSEQCGAKFVYVYICVNGDCKVCTNMVYVGKRCCQDVSATSESAFDNRDGEHMRASGKGVPKFDIHYLLHPMCFWRTMVYFYTGPDGDIPTRMAVAAVEHAIWKLYDAEGMAGVAYPPLVPNSGIYWLVAPLTGGPSLVGMGPLVARPLGDYFCFVLFICPCLGGIFYIDCYARSDRPSGLRSVARPAYCFRPYLRRGDSPLPSAGLLPIERPGAKGLSSLPLR